MFKIAMLILILLLVSMNVVEEEAHEYLAFFAAAVFVCHAAAQKWWFSAVCPRFGMALRINCLNDCIFVHDDLRSSSFQVRPPYAESQNNTSTDDRRAS